MASPLRACRGTRLDLPRRYPTRRPGTSRRGVADPESPVPGPEANAAFPAYNTDADEAAAGAVRAFATGDEGGPYAGVTGIDLSPAAGGARSARAQHPGALLLRPP